MRPTLTPLSPEELVALALNEQGFLLQHKIASVLEARDADGTFPHNWYIEAEELPVSLSDKLETRVDMLLRHGPEKKSPWRVVLESKRLSPDYKRWIFFAQTDRHPMPSHRKYYVERADLIASGWHHGMQSPPPMNHTIWPFDASNDCEVFDYYLEAKLEPPNRQQRASATEAIEDALYQVTLGQAGVADHLRRAQELNFRLIPVIVTTAEIFSAHFSDNAVSLDRGELQPADIKIQTRNWLAVNYRVSDVICQLSGFTTNLSSDLGAHVTLRQVRTVFVTRSTHLQQFLIWLGKSFGSLGFS